MSKKLLLVGCGKMGGALLRGIQPSGLISEIVVVDPMDPPHDLKKSPGILWLKGPQALPEEFVPDVIILAVKPQLILDVLPIYARFQKTVFLSIVAGTTLARMASLLNNQWAAIVRSMPNLPASIGQGVTVAVANAQVAPEQQDLCNRILQAVGQSFWVKEEALLNAVTALSGSGPAYVFALCEAMAKAGEKLGLSYDMAQNLALHTVAGSGALLTSSGETPVVLRRAVTSPKGTTEAALQRLLAPHGLDELVEKAMTAAASRAKELAK